VKGSNIKGRSIRRYFKTLDSLELFKKKETGWEGNLVDYVFGRGG